MLQVRSSFLTSFFTFVGLLLQFFPASGQLEIKGAPYTKADTEGAFRVECYLIKPEGVLEVKFPDASASKPLLSYRHTADEAQPVSDALYENGYWVVKDPQLGCGYIVEKTEGLPDYYWFCNYNDAPLGGELRATYSPSDPCERVLLETDAGLPTWSYFEPDGNQQYVLREVILAYEDLQFLPESFSFERIPRQGSFPIKEGHVELLAPLEDTNFRILGDNYSEDLGVVIEPLESNLLLARRLELYTRIEKISQVPAESDSLGNPSDPSDLSGQLSAPLSLRMEAIANEPAAARYLWKIIPGNNPEAEVTPLKIHAGREAEYTFESAGSFSVFSEAASREGDCLVQSDPQQVVIGTSRLEVPNAFSPFVSEGINDVFRVVHSSIVSFEGAIFNEWGICLFRWSDPNEGWDGTFRGKPVPNGVYYYVIQAQGADGKSYDINGNINLLGYDDTNPEKNTPGIE